MFLQIRKELHHQGEDPSQEDEVGRGAPEAAVLYCDTLVIFFYCDTLVSRESEKHDHATGSRRLFFSLTDQLKHSCL